MNGSEGLFPDEAIEKYFSGRPMPKEEYAHALALIRIAKEKPLGAPLTPLEQLILQKMDSLQEILPE